MTRDSLTYRTMVYRARTERATGFQPGRIVKVTYGDGKVIRGSEVELSVTSDVESGGTKRHGYLIAIINPKTKEPELYDVIRYAIKNNTTVEEVTLGRLTDGEGVYLKKYVQAFRDNQRCIGNELEVREKRYMSDRRLRDVIKNKAKYGYRG